MYTTSGMQLSCPPIKLTLSESMETFQTGLLYPVGQTLPTSHTTNHFIICKSMVTSLLKWYTVYGDRTWSRWSQGPDPQITHLQYFWSTTRQFPSPKFTEKNFLVSFGILKWPDHLSWCFFKMSFPFTNAVMFIMDALALANLLIYFGVII